MSTEDLQIRTVLSLDQQCTPDHQDNPAKQVALSFPSSGESIRNRETKNLTVYGVSKWVQTQGFLNRAHFLGQLTDY